MRAKERFSKIMNKIAYVSVFFFILQKLDFYIESIRQTTVPDSLILKISLEIKPASVFSVSRFIWGTCLMQKKVYSVNRTHK